MGRDGALLLHLFLFAALHAVEAVRHVLRAALRPTSASSGPPPHGLVLLAVIAAQAPIFGAPDVLAGWGQIVFLVGALFLAAVWPAAGRMLAMASLFLCAVAFAGRGFVMETDFISPKQADDALYPSRFSDVRKVGLIGAAALLIPFVTAATMSAAARLGGAVGALARSMRGGIAPRGRA